MKKNKKHGPKPVLPSWLDQAFKKAASNPEDDDCPICRAMRENTEPSSTRTIDLGDGTSMDVIEIAPSIQVATSRSD